MNESFTHSMNPRLIRNSANPCVVTASNLEKDYEPRCLPGGTIHLCRSVLIVRIVAHFRD